MHLKSLPGDYELLRGSEPQVTHVCRSPSRTPCTGLSTGEAVHERVQVWHLVWHVANQCYHPSLTPGLLFGYPHWPPEAGR